MVAVPEPAYPPPGSGVLGAPPALRRHAATPPADGTVAERRAADGPAATAEPERPAPVAAGACGAVAVAALLGAALGLALQRRWGR